MKGEFHCSSIYKVKKAVKIDRAIIAHVCDKHKEHITGDIIIFSDKNPRLHKMVSNGIRRNDMPLLNGYSVVINELL
jgi:hypothetical protein